MSKKAQSYTKGFVHSKDGTQIGYRQKGSINALHNVLPHVQLIELHGLNHDAAQDYGKPGPIAQEIKRFIQDAAKVSV